MKKKYLAYCINDLKKLSQIINGDILLLKKICQNFDKLFIINTGNLRFIKNKKDKLNKKDFSIDKKKSKFIVKNKNLKLPKNIELFNPKNIEDFENFMKDKHIIGINKFGRTFNDLKIHFLFKKFDIKQIQISDLGNLQSDIFPVKNYDIIAWYNKFRHDVGHMLTVILSNIGLVPKIDIRFTSNMQTFKSVKKNSLFKKLNFFYCKEHILINTKAYDHIALNNLKILEKKIVLLDVMFKHPEIVGMGDLPKPRLIKKFYNKINKFLKILENNYKKKIVVCIHPKDNLKEKKKLFDKYKVIKYATRKNIIESFMVLFFDTSAIVDAILLKKKIILLTTNLQGKNSIRVGKDYHKKTGVFKINLDNYELKNKKTLLNQLNKSKIDQLNYIRSYLAPDGENLGFEKIIKTIKKRFF